jgi:hypothetical protein
MTIKRDIVVQSKLPQVNERDRETWSGKGSQIDKKVE